MNFLSIITSIFLADTSKTSLQPPCIKNLTHHYQGEFPGFALDEVWVAQEYQNIKYTIERYKYHSEREKAHELAKYIVDIYRHNVGHVGEEKWYIVHVPMHWSRYITRGFDHISLIAKYVGQSTGLPVAPLLHKGYRKRQSVLDRSSRLSNKKGAFRLRNISSKIPENIILIDDVISSGSTAHACAHVLKSYGAKRVIGYFIASNQ